MLVDLTLKGSRVLIIGAGRVGLRKARSVLRECSSVTLASDVFTAGAKDVERAGVRLVTADVRSGRSLRKLLSSADLVIAATNDCQLNRRIAKAAHEMDLMVVAVDDPSESDFNFPAVRAVGDIRIGVTTGGRSPAMARFICKKLAGSISREDRLRVNLMEHVRNTAKRKLPSPVARRTAVYRIMEDEKVGELVRHGRLAKAKAVADALIGEG